MSYYIYRQSIKCRIVFCFFFLFYFLLLCYGYVKLFSNCIPNPFQWNCCFLLLFFVYNNTLILTIFIFYFLANIINNVIQWMSKRQLHKLGLLLRKNTKNVQPKECIVWNDIVLWIQWNFLLFEFYKMYTPSLIFYHWKEMVQHTVS